MKICILGIDGYIGWPLAVHLAKAGHEISGVDNGLRDELVRSVGGRSAFALPSTIERQTAWQDLFGCRLERRRLDVTQRDLLESTLAAWRPDAVVDLAEIPSAPYSMAGADTCFRTINNNVLGTLSIIHAIRSACPSAHLVKLGTMGEYGTPDEPIPESSRVPKEPGSWYHATKVCDSTLVDLACRVWGMRSTDIMQGIVYGTRTPATNCNDLATRFDYDSIWGTVINRFCAQAVLGEPLTVYGTGGQTRGYLPLQDSVECIRLICEHPPEQGEYRVVNQLADYRSVYDLASAVQDASHALGLDCSIAHYENPRVESEDHFYLPATGKLQAMGYEPSTDMPSLLREMLLDLLNVRSRIDSHLMVPNVHWRYGLRRSRRVGNT